MLCCWAVVVVVGVVLCVGVSGGTRDLRCVGLWLLSRALCCVV